MADEQKTGISIVKDTGTLCARLEEIEKKLCVIADKLHGVESRGPAQGNPASVTPSPVASVRRNLDQASLLTGNIFSELTRIEAHL